MENLKLHAKGSKDYEAALKNAYRQAVRKIQLATDTAEEKSAKLAVLKIEYDNTRKNLKRLVF